MCTRGPGADVTLIRMTCREDGTLLKPTTPAMYIDRVWQGQPGLGEVATARTTLQSHTWAFVSITVVLLSFVRPTMSSYESALKLSGPADLPSLHGVGWRVR